jgi:DNA invertase Pin-like site-specific DNA recombinase
MNDMITQGNPFGKPQKPKSMLNLGLYARKSNKVEEGQSKSKQEQIEFCHSVVDFHGFSRENVTVYDEPEGQKGNWYWQDDEGRNPGPFRPELTRLMADVAAGKIDVVICWRSDRLIRDNGVGDALAKAFRSYGTRLICGHRDVEIDTSTGLFQFNVEAANNRRWRDQISEDIIRDKQFKMGTGKFVRDPSCLGIRSKGKGTQAAEPIYEELEIVNRIFRMFVMGENGEGPMGINAICTKLMDEGISIAVGAKGHIPKHPEKVHTSGIRTILGNCEYIGKFRYNENEYDCKELLFPAQDGTLGLETAVPITLYETAQEKLRLTDRPGKKSVSSDHLLTGLIICAYCGRPLHVHNEARDKGKPNPRPPSKWFVCGNRRPPRYCKPFGMRMLQEDVVDQWVLSELSPLLAAEIRAAQGAAGRDADAQTLAELDRKILELTNKETKALTEMVGVMDADQIRLVASGLKAEREALQRKAEEIRIRLNRHSDLPDLSAESLANMPKATIKDALRKAVQWIAIGKEGVVVLTSFGTYIGAEICSIPKGTFLTGDTKTTIAPPTVETTLRCLGWFPSPEDFLKGRRDSGGASVENKTDAEILPGILDLPGCEPAGEIEVTYERLDEAI